MAAKPMNGTYYEIVGGLNEDNIFHPNTFITDNDIRNMAFDTERDAFRCTYENGILKSITAIVINHEYPSANSYKKIGEIYYEPLSYEKRMAYAMLDRLKQDCIYFLGYGNRHESVLWGGTVDTQIKEMKKRWNELEADEKPDWLTWEDIERFEKEMKGA